MVLGAVVVLAAVVLFGVVARALVQRRMSGTFGIRGVGHDASASEKATTALLAVAVVLFVVGVIVGEPTVLSLPTAVRAIGLVVAAAGVVFMLWAQWAMGDSWRIGVDETEEVELVVSGPFKLVRNPIFTSMCATGIGLAVAVPNVVMIAAAVCLVVAIEMQVRLVEEPHLRRTQGRAYEAYCESTGRFVPGIGTHG